MVGYEEEARGKNPELDGTGGRCRLVGLCFFSFCVFLGKLLASINSMWMNISLLIKSH